MKNVYMSIPSNGKIPAIKIFREAFGTDLRSSKDAIDHAMSGGQILMTDAQASLLREVINRAPALQTRPIRREDLSMDGFLLYADRYFGPAITLRVDVLLTVESFSGDAVKALA